MNRPDICANEQPFDEIGILSLRRSRWYPDQRFLGPSRCPAAGGPFSWRAVDVQNAVVPVPAPTVASTSVVGVAALAEGPAAGDELKEVQNLLNRLVRQQKPRGDYATTVVRDTGRPEAWFAFDDETDARKFGDAVQAETTATYPGWASQRAFELLGARLAGLEASLPAPRDNARQKEADRSRLSRRLRGGARRPIKRYDED